MRSKPLLSCAGLICRTKGTILRLRGALALWLLIGSTMAVHSAARTWTGSVGNALWSDAGNWSDGTVPSLGDDITIPSLPAGANSVRVTTDVSIRGLTVAAGSTLSVEGSSFEATGGSQLDGVSLTVSGGAVLSLPGLLSWQIPAVSWSLIPWTATDRGSRLELANLSEIRISTSSMNCSMAINATRGGTVSMPALVRLTGEGGTCCGGGSGINLSASGQGSVINLPLLPEFRNESVSPSASITVTSNGKVNAPLLSSIRGVMLSITDASLTLDSLTTAALGGITLSGAGILNAPRLTGADGVGFFVSGGAALYLPGLLSWQIPALSWSTISWTVTDRGSRLDLANLSEIRINTSSLNCSMAINATRGGAISMPSLVRMIGEGGTCCGGGSVLNLSASGEGSSIYACALLRAENATAGASTISAADRSLIIIPSAVSLSNFTKSSQTEGQIAECGLYSVAIARDPQSQNLYVGEPLELSVVVGGNLPVTYQWFHNGRAIPSARTSRFVLGAVLSGDAGLYTVHVGSPEQILVSQAAAVAVVPARSSYPAWARTVFSVSDLSDASISGPPADPDGDGLTNAQEEALRTNPRLADTDGDKVPDFSEAQAGSDPANPLSLPGEALDIQSAVEVCINALPLKSYQLQSSSDLLFWQDVGARFEGAGQPVRFLFSTRTAEPTFYRLRPE